MPNRAAATEDLRLDRGCASRPWCRRERTRPSSKAASAGQRVWNGLRPGSRGFTLGSRENPLPRFTTGCPSTAARSRSRTPRRGLDAGDGEPVLVDRAHPDRVADQPAPAAERARAPPLDSGGFALQHGGREEGRRIVGQVERIGDHPVSGWLGPLRRLDEPVMMLERLCAHGEGARRSRAGRATRALAGRREIVERRILQPHRQRFDRAHAP